METHITCSSGNDVKEGAAGRWAASGPRKKEGGGPKGVGPGKKKVGRNERLSPLQISGTKNREREKNRMRKEKKRREAGFQ